MGLDDDDLDDDLFWSRLYYGIQDHVCDSELPGADVQVTFLRLRTAATNRDRAQDEVDRLVGVAAQQGASWAAIGVELGLTRQAVHRRYGSAPA